jgi:Apea-like HEPN
MLTPLQEEARFARVVGMRFLSFVVAVREAVLETRLQGGQALQPAQEEVLGQVLAIAAQSAVVGFQTGGGDADFLYPLLEFDEAARTSRPNVFRRAAGGSVPRISVRDPAEQALATLARDIYPALLLDAPVLRVGPPRWIHRTWQMSPLSFRHPASADFEAAIEADQLLSQIFTQSSLESGRTGFIWTSLGTGRSIQLSMLSHDLLIAAMFEQTLDGTVDQTSFVDAAVAELRALWRLAGGEQLQVRCSIAFVGAELRGQPLELPWGAIRAPTAGELEIRGDTPVAHSQELVLSIQVPLQMRAESEPDVLSGSLPPNPLTAEALATYADIQRKADVLALTLLLGLEREPVVAIARTWTLIENPMNQGPSISWVQNAVPLHPNVIATPDRRRIRQWARRIERDYSDRIEIAMKRTLSALTTRWEPTDRLIDAVIALENLFGTGSGELAFRISAGCAYLLERDPARRLEMQKEVARLYTVRSKIVHGSHAPAPGDVEPDAAAAAALAVRSLRALFARHPGLIDDKDRARRLIFDR